MAVGDRQGEQVVMGKKKKKTQLGCYTAIPSTN